MATQWQRGGNVIAVYEPMPLSCDVARTPTAVDPGNGILDGMMTPVDARCSCNCKKPPIKVGKRPDARRVDHAAVAALISVARLSAT